MKSKVLTIALLVLLFPMMCFCFIGNSDTLENRRLATFQMVVSPEEKSVAYQDSVLERFEAAMKDQFHFRSSVINLYLKMDYYISHAVKKVLRKH